MHYTTLQYDWACFRRNVKPDDDTDVEYTIYSNTAPVNTSSLFKRADTAELTTCRHSLQQEIVFSFHLSGAMHLPRNSD